MKLVKMSLVAAMLMGASAFAIENVKVEGNANLFYSTDDSSDGDLFNQGQSAGQASLNLGVSADLTEGVSAGANMIALTTLGLYNNLVGNVWEVGIQDEWWFTEAWMAGTLGNTTLKAGRMALDTPLVFTETWSIAPNTFEALVAVNTDLPDTTLVGAYVGQHNGDLLGTHGTAGIGAIVASMDATDQNFQSFHSGAYAAGAVNTSIPDTTLQAWYFQATHTLYAYWLQADASIAGISLGAQYTGQEVKDLDTQDAFAVMAGYELEGVGALSAAFSSTTDETNGLGFVGANLSTGFESKLYTLPWWNFAEITQLDTTAVKVAAEATVAEVDLAAQYVAISHGDNSAAPDTDPSELAVTAAKSFGPVDTTLAYIRYDADTDADAVNMIQAYLTLNF